MSHVRTVESCEFERSAWESGETCKEVMVSVWPNMEYATLFCLKSQILMSLSIPPEYISFPASARATAVTGNSVSMKSMACFDLGSHSYSIISVKPISFHGGSCN